MKRLTNIKKYCPEKSLIHMGGLIRLYAELHPGKSKIYRYCTKYDIHIPKIRILHDF
jgi:hypothetical protein